MEVKIYDASCGSGKTTRIIDMVSKLDDNVKVIFVVPLLSECHRVAGTYGVEDEEGNVTSVPESISVGRYLYDTTHPLFKRFFKHPQVVDKTGSKLAGLKGLIEDSENIVTTHALFRNLTQDILQLIKERNYIIVIDEILNVYEEFTDEQHGSHDNIPELLNQGFMYLDEDGFTLCWDKDKMDASTLLYSRIQTLCESRSLLLIDKKVIILEFPIDILQSFKEVHVCTYLFKDSYMAGYLRFHEISYKVEHFGKSGKDFKDLIEIISDPKLNAIGDKETALSKSWCDRLSIKDPSIIKLKNNITNIFTHKAKVPIEQRMWTSFKSAKLKLSGKRYTNCWIPCSTKATNEYKDRKVVCYCANIFANPSIMKLLLKKNISVNQEVFAVSEMVQFIFRSCIRDGKKIYLYIPSRRMRSLLESWLSGNFDYKSY